MTEYQKLNIKLSSDGVPSYKFLEEIGQPIDTLVNSRVSSRPYVDTLLEFLPKVEGNEKEMIVRALAEKGIKKAVPFLIEMFHESDNYSELFLWAVGNALCEIDDKESYPDIIEICKNKGFGASRQMLFLRTLPKIKNDRAYEALLDGLEDNDVRGHALDGLGEFGNTAAISKIEKIEVEKGTYEYEAKERALKILKKKNSSQHDV